ncbi:MAG: crossover junction endodeoxyribonuclease [Deltaproteobacteria bacterium]|nr:MAG: crossover junction endodeoxyribonuclease [Deltaproteobacteria bacterium]
MLKVLGVDPGLAATGVGLVSGNGVIGSSVETYAFGSIRTACGLPIADRLLKIFSEISTLLDRELPDLMILEDVFILPHYPKSGLVLGRVSGVIMTAGARLGIPVHEISVREVKRIVTGNGNAPKHQLEKSVRERLGHPEKICPDHASDALGLALAGLYRFGMSDALRMVSKER